MTIARVMSTHWFHDHMLDFTAQNVYKGNAAMMNYYSAVDRGNEAINDGVNLRLPQRNGVGTGATATTTFNLRHRRQGLGLGRDSSVLQHLQHLGRVPRVTRC